MDIIKHYLKKVSRDVLFITVLMATAVITIYTIARAVESTADFSSATDSGTPADDAERKLTSEEIDKIIEDLKISGNLDNILDKLDEIISRAKLSGNTALQEYASNKKTAYELQKQLDSVKGLIGAMKKKNSDIDAMDKQIQKIISVSTIIEDLRGAVSDEALLVLESLADDDVKELQDLMVEINDLVDLNNISSLSVLQRSLLDILVLNKVIEGDLVDGERFQLAKDALNVAVTIFESYEKQKYSAPEYDLLVDGSNNFLNMGRKASVVSPEQVVFLNGYFNMNHPPIMYDNHILLAIDDLYQYVDAKAEYMYNNATIVITSPDKILEIVSGKNVAYLNDTPMNMPVPILNYNNTIYMPAESFAEAYDISYKYLPEQEFFIMYNNLVQLANPSVANKVNKD